MKALSHGFVQSVFIGKRLQRNNVISKFEVLSPEMTFIPLMHRTAEPRLSVSTALHRALSPACIYTSAV